MALNLLWIPAYGALGATWATDLTYGTSLAVSLVVFTRIGGRDARRALIPEADDLIWLKSLWKRSISPV